MGILDDLLGGALGGAMGRMGRQPQAQAAGGMGNVMTALLPIVLSMLANRQSGAPQVGPGSGGLGGVLGGIFGGAAGARGGMGGLSDVLEQFQRSGFGEQASSWVGTGQNIPISPDAIGQIFGEDALSHIARQAGVSQQEASQGLSQLLPEVVDNLTPSGQVPDLDQLSASVEALRNRLGG